MLNELGELFGWLLMITIGGAVLNYCLKQIYKYFGKCISTVPIAKKAMQILMSIFVKNHKYLGCIAILLLLLHSIIQFFIYGINITGMFAAIILLFQGYLGVYAVIKKKPRHGLWFILHRMITILLVISVTIHFFIPNALHVEIQRKESISISDSTSVTDLQTFTLKELSQYNGKKGQKAYIAYKGYVYDVTDHPEWRKGKHEGIMAGTDLTEEMAQSPHGDGELKQLKIVGVLK